MKKITVLQNELQADIKTIKIDETACRTVIDCKIKTRDQLDKVYEMYLQANQKLRHLRIKQYELLSVANNVNKKLKTDFLLDETLACIPVFNKIETSLINLEATILKIKLNFSDTSEAADVKKDIDLKTDQNAENESKTNVDKKERTENEPKIIEKNNVQEVQVEVKTKLANTTDVAKNAEIEKVSKTVDITKNEEKKANFLKKLKAKEITEIENESNKETQRKSLLERVSIKGSTVQVPKIEIIKDAAKVFEGKAALKQAFKVRDLISILSNLFPEVLRVCFVNSYQKMQLKKERKNWIDQQLRKL